MSLISWYRGERLLCAKNTSTPLWMGTKKNSVLEVLNCHTCNVEGTSCYDHGGLCINNFTYLLSPWGDETRVLPIIFNWCIDMAYMWRTAIRALDRDDRSSLQPTGCQPRIKMKLKVIRSRGILDIPSPVRWNHIQ